MISEKSREAFLELIRPPPNYNLTYCLGTTFSLELPCLIQLALNAKGKREELENITVYEGFELINDFSEKACVFTQNCRIKALPPEVASSGNSRKGSFFSLLDGIVEEVPIVNTHSAFHPKVWFIRFDKEANGDDPIFKLFVMSRNLTSSLKWDISACLVGFFGKPSRFSVEVISFFKMIHKKSSLKGKKNKIIESALKDLKQIEFQLPNKRDFKEVDFSFKWGKTKTWEKIDYSQYKKLIILSPFLSKGQIRKLDKHPDCILVTSKQDLDKLSEFENIKKNTYVMSSGDMDLHAKIYYGLHDNGTDIFIGSANCTDQAWEGDNVEANLKFLSTLQGFEKFKEEFIGSKGNIKYWLTPYESAFTPTEDPENEQIQIQEKLDLAQGLLSTGEFYINYSNNECEITFQAENISLPKGVTGSIKIIGIPEDVNLKTVLSEGAKLINVKKSDISSFVAIFLHYKNNVREFCTVAISNINRSQRRNSILSQVIRDWASFWDYLGVVLNLESQPGNQPGTTTPPDKPSSIVNRPTKTGVGLRYLEPLLLAGANEPKIIEKIENALKILEENKKNDSIHPDFMKFKGFWEEYKAAFKEFNGNG